MYNNVDNTFKSPLTTISIGPGIRGIERGVERVARLVHLAYVEIEAYIIENLVAQMEAGLLAPAVIWSDAKTLPCEPFRGLVDLLLAGYPCQPFSTAGKRRGTEDPRHLFPYIERAIRIIRPRACFFENVRGHITCGLPEVIASLEGLGYRVHWGIYSAEETGAAHKRERVFILAILADAERGGRREDWKHGWMERVRRAWQDNSMSIEKSGSELADHNSINGREQQQIGSGDAAGPRDESAGSCELADNHCEGKPQSEGNYGEGGQWPSHRSESVGYTDDSGLQGWIIGECDECSGKRLTRSNGPFDRVSRPGQPQQAWEHPRVISREIESALGLSANGYHFREDVLRALGNSVYEDTAELAFRDLLRKHGIESIGERY